MEAVAGLLVAALWLGTPLLLGALGALLAERGGTIALSLEGQMLAGALAAALTGPWLGPWAAGAAAMAAGLAVGGAAAVLTGRFRADHVLAGMALNLLVLGLGSFLLRLLSGGPPPVPPLGPVLLGLAPLSWTGLALVPLLALGLGRTAPGLALRAAGEDPAAARAAGLRPDLARGLGMLAGGLLGGLAGAALALQHPGAAAEGMTEGRGFLALAAVILGRWRPGPTLLACLGFGLAEALSLRLPDQALPFDRELVQALPNALALLVLLLAGHGPGRPAALGRPIGR